MAHGTRLIRVLALAHADMLDRLREQIESFGMMARVVTSADQLASHIRAGDQFQVVLLPATLPNAEDMWQIWGDLAVISPRSAILVYAQTASFELWSGVLEVGGYDVIVEPLSDERLKEALLRAAEGASRMAEEYPGAN